MREISQDKSLAAKSGLRKRLILVLKALGVIVSILVLGLTVLYFMLPGIVLDQLNRNLSAEVSAASVTLDIREGRIRILDLNIGQPEGFGDIPLLRAKQAELQLVPSSLFSECIVIQRILLSDVNCRLLKDKQGRLNVNELTKAGSKTTPEPAGKDASTKAILLEDIALSSFNFSYADAGSGNNGLELVLTNMTAAVSGLRIDASAADAVENTATAEITGFLKQLDLPSSPFCVYASVGPVISTNIPSMIVAARLVDLELSPLGLMYPGINEILGGDALDLWVNVLIRQDLLDCRIDAVMDSGQKHNIVLRGTPFQPEYDKTKGLGLVFSRVTGIFGNTLANIGTSGAGAVGAVTDTVAGAIKGAGKTVGDLGSGLAATAVSAVKLDIKGAASNLTKTAVGVVGNASGTVVDATMTLASGATQATRDASGRSSSATFRSTVEARRQKVFVEAQAWVKQQAFPPERPGQKAEKRP